MDTDDCGYERRISAGAVSDGDDWVNFVVGRSGLANRLLKERHCISEPNDKHLSSVGEFNLLLIPLEDDHAEPTFKLGNLFT